MDELVQAWRKVTDGGLLVLPGDQDVLEEHQDCTVVHDSFDEACEDPLFWQRDGRFHLNLVPIPYQGSLEKADIFVLLMNPSLAYRDYLDEKTPEYRRLLFDNLHQRRMRRFPGLSPKYIRYSDGEYWLPRFAGLAQVLEAKVGSFQNALKLLAEHAAVLELVPYRAMELGLPGTAIEKLASVQLMREFVNSELAPRAAQGEVLIIVARQVRRWGLEASKNVVVYSRPGEPRGAYVSPATRGGQAILSFLETRRKLA